MKIRKRKALTFDDVLLVPHYSPVRSRRDVSTETILLPNFPLHIPIVSSNMDTVTESNMAIAMAHAGGLGIIHRFMTIERMAQEVRRVKRAENLVIENPVTISSDATVAQARRVMQQQDIGGLLILDEERRLLGILTTRDVLFEDDATRTVRELMTTEVITAPSSTTLEEARVICHRARVEKLPLVDESGRVTGLITTKDILKRIQHPKATKDEKGRLRVGVAIGVKHGERERAAAVVEAGVDVLVLDIAHGHSTNALEMISFLKREFPQVPLIAGNVATGDGTKALIDAGADAIKVGIGPGSICLNRDAQILMADNSVKPICQVQLGDHVVTHSGRIQPVIKTYRRWYQGSMVALNVCGCPDTLHITPNHEVLAITFDALESAKNGGQDLFSNTSLRWVRADELKRHDLLVIPKQQYTVEAHVFDLAKIVPHYHYDQSAVWATTSGINPNEESDKDLAFNTSRGVMSTIVTDQSEHKLSRFISLDSRLMRLLGYYLTKGYVVGNQNNRKVHFTFKRHESAYVEDVCQLVSDIFAYNRMNVRQSPHNTVEIVVHHHAIAHFFETLIPSGVSNKRVPGFVLNQSRTNLRQLLIGALRGDGCLKEPTGIAYKTTSPHLANQIAEVFTRLGYLPSIQSDEYEQKNGSTSYHVHIGATQGSRFADEFPELGLEFESNIKPKQQIFDDEKYIYVPIRSVELEENQELEVFNLEVAEDNTYVANRVAVHNCVTRIVTGFGMPQITAIMDSYEEAHKAGIPIIADGGIRTSGDMTKALAAGAHTVMIGSLFAGTRESPGRIMQKKGRRYKVTRGMASLEATMSRTDRGDEQDWNSVVPEGVEAMVPYRGSIDGLLTQLVGGLRSGLSYAGATNIEELHENAEFLEMSVAGLNESKPHDVELM